MTIARMQTETSTLLSVRHLVKHFPVEGSDDVVQAVDDVSFDIIAGETLGLVGESGCGKSTVGRCLLRLHEPTSGEVLFEGKDIVGLPHSEMQSLRRQMQIIFQDPYASLNPRLSIRSIISEPLKIHRIGSKAEQNDRVADLLQKVGLDPKYADRYPHEFSGGQRQRIGIARALALNPKLIICDEPVSALDVSVQAQVVNLLQDLQDEFGLTLPLHITRPCRRRTHIEPGGRDVSRQTRRDLRRPRSCTNCRSTHTHRRLLSAIPVPDPKHKRDRIVLNGDVPTPINPPSGLPFRTRCPIATDECAGDRPELREIHPGHFAACIKVDGYEDATSLKND